MNKNLLIRKRGKCLTENLYSFQIIPLAVSNFSKYLRTIKKNNNESKWSLSDFESVLENKYFLEIDRFSLMDFLTSQHCNPLWIQMKNALAYYKKKKFSYKISIDKTTFHINYQEFINKNIIKDIEFDNIIYWIILSNINKKKLSKNELIYLIQSEHNLKNEFIGQCVNELIEQGLLITDKTFNNIVSIINIE